MAQRVLYLSAMQITGVRARDALVVWLEQMKLSGGKRVRAQMRAENTEPMIAITQGCVETTHTSQVRAGPRIL